MPNCKICGRPIVEYDMKICRKCRSEERTTPLSLLKKAVKRRVGICPKPSRIHWEKR